MTEQVFVSLAEAAELTGRSAKSIRRLVYAGKVRSEKRRGKWGQQLFVDPTSLPPARPGHGRGAEGVDNPKAIAPEGFDFTGWLDKHEGLLVRLGQLEGERERRLALEARAGSLVEAEAVARARSEQLGEEVIELRGRLRWRAWAVALLLAAIITLATAALLRG